MNCSSDLRASMLGEKEEEEKKEAVGRFSTRNTRVEAAEGRSYLWIKSLLVMRGMTKSSWFLWVFGVIKTMSACFARTCLVRTGREGVSVANP